MTHSCRACSVKISSPQRLNSARGNKFERLEKSTHIKLLVPSAVGPDVRSMHLNLQPIVKFNARLAVKLLL
jgi:hypothetical protein